MYKKKKQRKKGFIVFITFCNSKRNLSLQNKMATAQSDMAWLPNNVILKTKNMKIFFHLTLDIKLNFLVLYFGIKLNHI